MLAAVALLAQTLTPDGPGPAADVPLVLPEVAYSAILPELILVGGALVLLLATSMFRAKPRPGLYSLFTVGVAVAGLVSSWRLWDRVTTGDGEPYRAFGNTIVVDGFSVFFKVLILAAVAIAALIGESYLRRDDVRGPEFHVLVMLSAAGASLMAAGDDLIVLFLGLEILSLPLFVLAAMPRRPESHEAAMKYFILSAFSSALFLYGIALTYGATGTTSLPGIAGFLAGNVATASGVLYAGMGLLLVGFAFKIAAVPFHQWTPDVYQGAPSPVTGFMASVAKAGGFAALLRVFFSTFTTLQADWQPLVGTLAVITLLVGSVVAIVQSDIKRMLAYSSISHAGYILVGLQAATNQGVASSLFYLLTYSFMALGSFAVVTVVGRRGDTNHALESYKGLSARRPGLALIFTVLLLAQAGLPLTSGFFAKFYVITAAVESRSYALAIVSMAAAAVAAFFYLRVIVLMYSPIESDDEASVPRAPGLAVSMTAALTITAGFTVAVGVLPGPVLDFARHAQLIF